jgi:hypothetical protein
MRIERVPRLMLIGYLLMGAAEGGVASQATRTPPAADARLTGLDRFYFRRITAAELRPAVRPYLPDSAASPLRTPIQVEEGDAGDKPTPAIDVRDVECTGCSASPAFFVRQCVDSAEWARTDEIRWALYWNGRRTDLWEFSALTGQTGDRFLSNYRLQTIEATGPGKLLLHVVGKMARPSGAFWVDIIEASASLEPTGIHVEGVRRAFRLFHDYEHDCGACDTVSVVAERDSSGRTFVRSVNVPSSALAPCGWDHVDDVPYELPPTAVMSTAMNCVLSRSRARSAKWGEVPGSFYMVADEAHREPK